MPTNRKLRTALLAQLHVGPRRLLQLSASAKTRYGPMRTEDAIHLVAHENGLDISRYLSRDETERIRAMVRGGPAPMVVSRSRTQARTSPPKAVPQPDVKELDRVPISSSVISDARRMALVYPKFYVLENLLRETVERAMSAAYGANWWTQHVGGETQKKVAERRANEAKKPWHGKRGTQDLGYCDFADLRHIIEKNWQEFAGIFPDRNWITVKLVELETPRNILAHSNPVSADDETRIGLYLRDISSLINSQVQTTATNIA